MGYCALDRARTPLQGDEVHACWQAPVTVAADDQGLFAVRTRALATAGHGRPAGPVVPRSAATVERSIGPGRTAVGRRAVAIPVEPRFEGRLVEAPSVRPTRSIEAEPVIVEPSVEVEGQRLPHGRPVT